MATVTGLTAARMKEIEDASVVDGEVIAGKLILEKHDGTTIDAGSVIGPPGPQGPAGPPGIPGEIKLWPGDALPAPGVYGVWVWADGAEYDELAHPIAAAHISDLWNTFAFGSNPPVVTATGKFRVPDLRGLVVSGTDQMPGGARVNRIPRPEAIIIAKTLGEHQHKLVQAEMAKHNHGRNVAGGPSEGGVVAVGGSISGTATWAGTHAHTSYVSYDYVMKVDANNGQAYRVTGISVGTNRGQDESGPTSTVGDHQHPVGGSLVGAAGTLDEKGGDIPHENLQPTVFVPYIVCLDTV